MAQPLAIHAQELAKLVERVAAIVDEMEWRAKIAARVPGDELITLPGAQFGATYSAALEYAAGNLRDALLSKTPRSLTPDGARPWEELAEKYGVNDD